ncbi:stage II sporulation protein R [Paenibacillus sp. MZ04-78.2]|uniref:stage II sporulation protein R n=1 Tax=Paenibacillus sp. MZ04-78.2 TaxID=2962034 RepID=UPI0020B6CB9F|nr:stage II sporulation protein R [Paenibacillus sp. MZ04-78.2]MCP3775331.1 stage II sporulation protein R [Paenibacillus sp. MZ04-78.2]
MVKRFAWKRYAYLAFALMVMLACWETNRSNAMLVTAAERETEAGSSIPKEAIRLRILANSDAPADQWVKREVRDAVMEQMQSWATEPRGIEAARQTLRDHLPELDKLVGETLRKNGFDYTYRVELGMVPFPAKVYNNEVYPEGDYEALRIAIGAAEGQNWWCVLFPPLCFADTGVVKKNNTAYAAAAEESAENGGSAPSEDAPASKQGVAETGKKSKPESKSGNAGGDAKVRNGKAPDSGKASGPSKAQPEAPVEAPQPEVRFFLWDLMNKVGSWFA